MGRVVGGAAAAAAGCTRACMHESVCVIDSEELVRLYWILVFFSTESTERPTNTCSPSLKTKNENGLL
jgi:hypothetical protein